MFGSFIVFHFKDWSGGRTENFFAICWSMNTQIAFPCSSTFSTFAFSNLKELALASFYPAEKVFYKENTKIIVTQHFYIQRRCIIMEITVHLVFDENLWKKSTCRALDAFFAVFSFFLSLISDCSPSLDF